MEQENCSRIWSWSKFNCFKTSPFEYYLKYIKHAEEDRQDCIYTSTGSLAHDIIEKFYTSKIKYEDMIDNYNDGFDLNYEPKSDHVVQVRLKFETVSCQLSAVGCPGSFTSMGVIMGFWNTCSKWTHLTRNA